VINMEAAKMRPSRVLKKLREGGTAICTKLNLADPRVAEIAAMSGFDCLWNDMEHVPNDLSVIEQQIRAAKAYDVDLLVRVARGSYSDYVRPLEADATGIMVPHIMSLEDAQAVVRMTRFNPIGRRPLDGGNADGAYCVIPLEEYLKQANEQRFVVIQIEDPEPMSQLDEIAALEGIDMLFFGPGDFCHAIGAPGQWDHPEMLEARRRVAEAALSNGKYAGTVSRPESMKELIDIGYRFINLGADVLGLYSYFSGLLDAAAGRTAIREVK
jgi:4-hydroxy-2-oxoheptanedioate aldolase